MTNEEVIGAFHFFGPELYQLISGKVFDIEASDFNENGKFRRLNRQNPNGNAVSEGRPVQVTSLYAYTWAERTRWIQYYEQQGMDSAHQLQKPGLVKGLKKSIWNKPFHQMQRTPVFSCLGYCFFPNP